MAEALIKYETIDSTQIADIMQGKVPKPPKGWDDDSSQNIEPSNDGNTKEEVGKLKSKNTKIGGPASLH
jgi:cell division protease FtsH